MKDIQNKLNDFKQMSIDNFNKANFAYKEWFVKDHLMIVERIAMELCDIYDNADRDVVFALVWLHDFGKALDENNEFEMTKIKGAETLRSVGLDNEFVSKVMKFWLAMEKKTEIDIASEAIEVQIISTADGASHFIGKFYASYFGDDPKESIQATEQRLKAKIIKDWERKIVLPEVKRAFEDRYLRALEIIGEYPDSFINSEGSSR